MRFFCCFNGGLCGGCVVDDEEKKHAKTKKNCSGVLLIFSLKNFLLFVVKPPLFIEIKKLEKQAKMEA